MCPLNTTNKNTLKVFRKIRHGTGVHAEGVHSLVYAAREHRRLVRGRERRRRYRLCQLLSLAVHHHEPSAVQASQGRLLVLQRGHQDATQRSHERSAHCRQKCMHSEYFLTLCLFA